MVFCNLGGFGFRGRVHTSSPDEEADSEQNTGTNTTGCVGHVLA